MRRLLLCFTLSVGLAGCTLSTHLEQTPAETNNLSADQVRVIAEAATGPEQAHLNLKAAKKYLQEGNLTKAQQLLNRQQRGLLTHEDSIDSHLLRAKLAILEQDPMRALRELKSFKTPQTLPRPQRINYHTLKAAAYLNEGNRLESVRERIMLDTLLTNPEAKTKNQESLWKTLNTLTPQALRAFQTEPAPDTLSGWLALARITKTQGNHSTQLFNTLQKWRQDFPNHPAMAFLPKRFPAQSSLLPSDPKKIALLLPLSGKLAKAGSAVRDGFLAAYYQTKKKTAAPLSILSYDTSQKDVRVLAETAIAEGAEVIVGPLTKTNAEQLANDNKVSAPVIALNRLSQTTADTPFFQFGLSPIDETTQVATKAWEDGQHHALIITTKDKWGQTISDSFKSTWTQLGGTITDEMSYQNTHELSKQIQALLLVDASNQRHAKLAKILREKIKFIPRRRQDADMIFLVAEPKIARQIRPRLSFYFAGNIPVYATSAVYAGIPDPSLDRDMNGVQFCDMPWVLKTSGTMRKVHDQIAKLWPHNFSNSAKLYALGYDAYELSNSLNRLLLFPRFTLNGVTGQLSLNEDNQIQRQLVWAQFRDGHPRVLPGQVKL